MSSANFFKTVILFLMPLILMACNQPDFGKVKPDFSQIKKIPTSILNIGKKFNGSISFNFINFGRPPTLW